MKYAFSLAVIFGALVAAPVFAADGNVPQSTLNDLGLARMETLSDAEGMQVRGSGGGAAVRGISLVAGLLLEPSTKNFVFASDANTVEGNAEIVCLGIGPVAVSHTTESVVAIGLEVTTPSGDWVGVLIGGAGGSGYALAQ